MYCYMFEVSEQPFDSSEEWQDESVLYEHPELLPIASHISHVEDRKAAMEELGTYLAENQIGTITGEKIILSDGHRKQFSAKRYQRFQELLKKLQNVNAEQFSEEYVLVAELIDSLYNTFIERYDYYMMLAIDEVMPFDEFVRRKDSGIPFYIGLVVKFHC